MLLNLTIEGKQATQGSKIPMPGKRFGVKDSCKELPAWRHYVALEARRSYRDHIVRDRPLAMTLIFQRPRPKSHLNSKGDVKPKAPAYPTTRPDSIKMARAIEDALSGVIYHDDSQIVKHQILKTYGDRYETTIRVEEVK